MVYQNKLVAAIKVNGQILRENQNVVAIPFGSEYSIYLKNLNTRRVKVRVSIDGQDVTGGTSLVIAPNTAMDLERFIRNGNWSEGNRFKFIERSGAVEAHRGIKAEDGIVRVEYDTEQPAPVITTTEHHHYDHYHPSPWYPSWPYPRWYPTYTYSTNHTKGVLRSASRSLGASTGGGGTSSSVEQFIGGSQCFNNSSSTFTAGNTDPGITVEGGVSHQQFVSVADFPTTGQSDVLVLMLRGVMKGKTVKHAITVKTKVTCKTCGTKAKAMSEFCAKCGTALAVV